jgi:DNA repair protein RecO (recombination protein O)
VSRVRLNRTPAIVLKRHDYGEADRILTLYTRDSGKVRAIAKAVRRIASRKSGHIELFTHTDVLLAEGRSLDVLTQAQTIEPFAALREDLIRTTYAYHVAELVDRTIEDGEASPQIFELLRSTLDGLCRADDPSLVVRWFEVRFLGMLGYRPQLFACVRCGRDLDPAGNAYDPAAGGVLCGEDAAKASGSGSIALDPAAFRVLRFLQTRDLETSMRIEITPATRGVLERVLHGALHTVLERQLKSVEFLEGLRRVSGQLGLGRAPGGDAGGGAGTDIAAPRTSER